MTAINPIATMNATEARLTAAIDATAQALDHIGTTNLERAMARLKESANAAKARLAAAHAEMLATVADVLGELDGFTGEIVEALATNEQPVEALPAPAPTTPAPQWEGWTDNRPTPDDLVSIDAGDDEVIVHASILPAVEAPTESPVITMAANDGPATKPAKKRKR